MAIETVRVYAVDEDGDALAGVLVRVFDSLGVFVTQNTTSIVGSDAYAEFSLSGDVTPTEYTIRLSKTGVAFDGLLGTDSQTPQAISVYSPATSANDFTVQGQTFSRPAATDPRMCRASGFFKDLAGRALSNLPLHFVNTHNPTIVDGFAVLGGTKWGKTDSDGYFEVDLYRGAEMLVTIGGLEDDSRSVKVPDASSVNLVNLLFPIPGSVTYDPVSVSVAAEAYQDVTVVLLDTAGNVLDLLEDDVSFLSDVAEVATAEIVDETTIRVTGVAAGSANIEATRRDTTIVVVDDITLDSLPVTVV